MTVAPAGARALAVPGDIPALDRLLNDAVFAALLAAYGCTEVTAALRGALDALRARVVAGGVPLEQAGAASIAAGVAATLDARHRRALPSRGRTRG